jgi:hypothetical protein
MYNNKRVKQTYGRCVRWPRNLTYRNKPSDEISKPKYFPICESGVVLGCQNRSFWTGLRPKHDIIGGAWSRCNLIQEKAYATL